MELDLKYKMQDYEQIISELTMDDSKKMNQPYQEIKDYLENKKNDFYYKEIIKILNTFSGKLDIVLSDGSTVKLARAEGIVTMGIVYPDKSKFIASWTSIADQKEFMDSITKVTGIK